MDETCTCHFAEHLCKVHKDNEPEPVPDHIITLHVIYMDFSKALFDVVHPDSDIVGDELYTQWSISGDVLVLKNTRNKVMPHPDRTVIPLRNIRWIKVEKR